jgi:hypothetical protein
MVELTHRIYHSTVEMTVQVKKLCKHASPPISAAATDVVKYWQKTILNS